MKLILDLDTGIDDALALSYALGDPAAEVIGVTCTYGNVVREQALKNTATLLKVLGRKDIPLFAGSAHPLNQTAFAPTPMCRVVHGEHGFSAMPRQIRTDAYSVSACCRLDCRGGRSVWL